MIGIFRGHKLIMPLLLVGVAFFGWFLHRTRSGDFDNIEISKGTGVDASISIEQAKFYARDLFDAMNRVGTNTDVIEKIIFSVNPEDWRLIHNAFGYKKYALAGHDKFFGKDKDLKGWLLNELDFFDKKIKNRVKVLYEANGIIY